MIGINQHSLLLVDGWNIEHRRDCEPSSASAIPRCPRRNQENSNVSLQNSDLKLDDKMHNYSSASASLKTEQSHHFLHPVKNGRRLPLKRTSSPGCLCVVTSKQKPEGISARAGIKPYHGNARVDNSLLVTTRKFMALKNINDTVNLNNAAEELNVPKRRLYDITNVLEGIDLVEKIGKNSIRWKTNDGDASVLDALKAECRNLQAEEVELDAVLLDLASTVKLIREDPTSSPHATYLCPPDSSTHSSVEDVLSTGDHIEDPCDPCTKKFESFPVESVIESGHIEERKLSNISEDTSSNEFVLPKTQFRRDSLSDLVTPDVAVLHTSTGISPLKVLVFYH
ncbi:unnamed protein product [Strongylus vulgaris]|uniref:E2F/DP family winged-helix DNA-binding domain-containing protein n=1 Tax=Strongylus vulgaris TaxID=40348 RepID=A0A3P7IVP4_STRVU|nr:unnamed protein product [Strongylus vulgaris]